MYLSPKVQALLELVHSVPAAPIVDKLHAFIEWCKKGLLGKVTPGWDAIVVMSGH
jgi:hypothetical protein